jgi:hypothetical protein
MQRRQQAIHRVRKAFHRRSKVFHKRSTMAVYDSTATPHRNSMAPHHSVTALPYSSLALHHIIAVHNSTMTLRHSKVYLDHDRIALHNNLRQPTRPPLLLRSKDPLPHRLGSNRAPTIKHLATTLLHLSPLRLISRIPPTMMTIWLMAPTSAKKPTNLRRHTMVPNAHSLAVNMRLIQLSVSEKSPGTPLSLLDDHSQQHSTKQKSRRLLHVSRGLRTSNLSRTTSSTLAEKIHCSTSARQTGGRVGGSILSFASFLRWQTV